MLKFFPIIIISFLIGTQFENILQYFDDVQTIDSYKKINNRICIETLGLQEENLKKLTNCKEKNLSAVYLAKVNIDDKVEKVTNDVKKYNQIISNLNSDKLIYREEYNQKNFNLEDFPKSDDWDFFFSPENNKEFHDSLIKKYKGKKIKIKIIFEDEIYDPFKYSGQLIPEIILEYSLNNNYSQQVIDNKIIPLFKPSLSGFFNTIKPKTIPRIKDTIYGTFYEASFELLQEFEGSKQRDEIVLLIEDIVFGEIPSNKEFIKESVISNLVESFISQKKEGKGRVDNFFHNYYNETLIRKILSE